MASTSGKSDDDKLGGGDRLNQSQSWSKRQFPDQPHAKKRFLSNDKSSSNLPVHQHRETFFKLLNEHPTLLVIGETGSGKTTQIPRWCMEYCMKKGKNLGVACTQPRRIAAMSVSARVAKEMRVSLGQEVGYSVRFESRTSPKTRLKYLTDGMLLREAMLDGMLSSYGFIILDEAHERTLQTEILFGVIKRALTARNQSLDKALPPLKVIVMSATINVKLFKRYFNSPVLAIEGRQHPVQELFAEVPQTDLLTSTLISVFQVHRTCEAGDILVFCSGQDEIQSLVTLCKKVLKHAPESLQNLSPLPLYASLPASHQMRVFDYNVKPYTNGFTNGQSSDAQQNGTKFDRRVIFATNVAETSVTIPNIKYVIDTGKVKCRTYYPETGRETLKVVNTSKAQAKQRCGRAGRIGPGTCYRLYTSEDYDSMSDHLPPEIKRCSLDSVLLQMISIGISNIGSFEFLEKPHDDQIKSALVSLAALGAIKANASDDGERPCSSKDDDSWKKQKFSKNGSTNDESVILNLSYEPTNLGKKLAAFPLVPSMSRILIAAHEFECLDEALTIVSLLSIENLFHIPPNKQSQAEAALEKFKCNEGDTIMLLKVFKAFRRTLLLNRSGLKQWCTEHFIHAKNLKMARLIRKQLADICRSLNMGPSSCGQDTEQLRRAIGFGLFNKVAFLRDGGYSTHTVTDIHIHPSSCLFRTKPECLLYTELIETNKCYMRHCTLFDKRWLRDIPNQSVVKARLLINPLLVNQSNDNTTNDVPIE